MYLPTEVWSSILLNFDREEDCQKLYDALPTLIKIEIKDIYQTHLENTKVRLVCGFLNNCILHTISKTITFGEEDESIKFVRFVNNMNTIVGIRDCIVTVNRNNKIIFYDGGTCEYIESISPRFAFNINNIEFHPNRNIMFTKSRHEIKMWSPSEGRWLCSGNRCNIISIKDSPVIFLIHPTKPYLFIVKYESKLISPYPTPEFQKEILEIYLWKYNFLESNVIEKINFRYRQNSHYLPAKLSPCGNFIETILSYGNTMLGGLFLHRTSIDGSTVCYPRNVPKINLFSFRINDYCWKDDMIYYSRLGAIIKKDIKSEIENILYLSYENIERIFIKNNFIIFLEKDIFKKLYLDKIDENNNIDLKVEIILDIKYYDEITVNDYLLI